MSESSNTSYEEARRCPKCHKYGEVVKEETLTNPRFERGTKLQHIECRTELCPWYETQWLVQVNPDGSIPPPKNHRGEKKVYQGFKGHDEIAARVLSNLRREREASQRPGTEVRNPFGP